MSPRIIHIPLSGGDRKAQAKGIRYAHGVHASHYRQSVLIRSAAEAKLREADRLECEAWNAIMWAGGPAMPSPGEPQAEPTIGKAINGGYDLLEAKCNRCDRVSLVPLRSLKHPPATPVWKLEAALYCEPCSDGRHYSHRQRAHILGLTHRPAGPRDQYVQSLGQEAAVAMKYSADRPFADPEKAARKLLEIANTTEAVQDGRIYVEKINGLFLFKEGGTPEEYGAGLKLAIDRGCGTYVKFTQAGADLFA